MKIPLSFDLETALIRPALQAPPPACMTFQARGEAAGIVDSEGILAPLRAWLADPRVVLVGANVAFDACVVAEAFPEIRPALFAAYDADRVTDVQLRQKLLDIAGGVYMGRVNSKGIFIKHLYDLESLAKRIAGMQIQKDAWRTSYAAFIGVPLVKWRDRAVVAQYEAVEEYNALGAAWQHVRPKDVPVAVRDRLTALREMVQSDPSRCTSYAINDAVATLAVYEKQEAHALYLADQFRQARADFWLALSSAWGLRTDAEGVETFRRETQREHDELEQELVLAGLVRPDGSRDTKAAKRRMIDVCRRDGLTVRRTDGHAEPGKCKRLDGTPVPDGSDECEDHVSLDYESCNATEDETLIDYASLSELKKVLTTDIEKVLSQGVTYPVHPRYGLAETGRTTCSKPNIQNLRRKAGIREAFVPRPGRVFAQADYPTLELYTLAQCCVTLLGESRLGEALNKGIDPHLLFGAQLLGITYDEAKANKKRRDVKRGRQLAKAANFGFPGGMGIPKFVAATRKATIKGAATYEQGRRDWEELGLDEKRARELKDAWLAAWPEMVRYFAHVNDLCDNATSRALVESLFTKRWRGGATYCATSNTRFQGLASDCAKQAGWLIAKAQYVEPASPLFNSRTAFFVHDEFGLEVFEHPWQTPSGVTFDAHDAAVELARLMVVGANTYLPDVPIPMSKMEPLLMRRWFKNAEPKFAPSAAHGGAMRLVPWS